jgi:uncharacterized tellurite resistance protein B-like protein
MQWKSLSYYDSFTFGKLILDERGRCICAGRQVMSDADKRIAILQELLATAWADGSYDEREQRLMNEIATAFGNEFGDGSSRLYGRRGLADVLTSRDERYYCYQQAAKMSYADGRLSSRERLVLNSLRDSLQLTDSDVASAEEGARAVMSDD